jgi:hypothetical protein
MSGVEINIDGLIPATRRLNSLQLTGIKKRRELTKLARKVISNSKKRVRQQTDLDGGAYRKRHKKRKDRGKMLARLYQRLQVMRNDGGNADISFPGVAATIAAAQQYGQSQTVTATSLRGRNGGDPRDGPATKKQGKALRDLGYKIKGRKPSISWITQHMKVGQAGCAIKWLREKQGLPARSSWTTRLPARSALGATSVEVDTLIDILINDITDVI